MEDVSLTTEPDGPRRDELAHALAAQRARVGEFVAGHQQRLRQAEAAFEAALARLRQQERELDERRRDHEAEAEVLARQRHALQEKRTEVEQAGEALAAERQETKIQRRRIAQEFQAQRAAHLKDLQRERDELEGKQAALGEAAELAAQLEAGRRQCAVLERQLAERAEAIEAVEDRLRAAGAVNESLQRRLNDALDTATAERASFEARLAEAQEAANGAADPGVPGDFADERERLTQTLRDTENRLAETERRLREAQQDLAEAPKVQTVRELAEAQRRYEMAMEDLREQKQRTSELEKKLAEAPRPSAASATAGPMDWESQKRRMLEALEANTDDAGQGERHEEHLKIHEVIAQTSATLAGKEKELHELRRQLADKSSHDAACDAKVASDAAISNDELVRTERERLRQLQLEWEEKLRQAEVDLSVERAKMARERAEIEEIQRRFNESQSQSDEQPGGGKDKKPQRGRWLARLGLKDDDAG